MSGLSIIPILYLLGAAQGAFLALALFTSKAGSKLANRYLGALTLVFTVALIDYFLDITNYTEKYVWIRALLWPKEFLYGILIYFYVRELTIPKTYFLKGKQWIHFIPFFLHVIATWPLLFLRPDRQIGILKETVTDRSPDTMWSFILGDFELYLTIIQITVYLLLSLKLIQNHNTRIQNTFSYSEKINLHWLRWLLLGIFVVYVIWLIEQLFSQWLELKTTFEILLGLSMVILIYGMGYLGLRQPVIFSQTDSEKVTAVPKKQENKQSNKYKNSPLSPDLSKAFADELEGLMQTEKPFLDSKLSLPQLAEMLGISVNYLSQTINEQQGKNFFDYINSYRIEVAKQKLSNPQTENQNILNVAMDSGFNSKSAFYTAFKKHTGMTPSQYKNQ